LTPNDGDWVIVQWPGRCAHPTKSVRTVCIEHWLLFLMVSKVWLA
jgi:hypothetical protein